MNTAIMKARDIIAGYRGPKLRIMEVCGTHTHEIFRLGIRSLLPENVALISGPGCPVCVTPVSYIDEAIFLAEERHATICTFGDLVRVPGTAAAPASRSSTRRSTPSPTQRSIPERKSSSSPSASRRRRLLPAWHSSGPKHRTSRTSRC